MSANSYINKFIIAAYIAPPPPCAKNHFDDNLMEEGYRLASMAGFNVCYGYYEKWPENAGYVKKALTAAEKYDIGYLIYDTNYSKKKRDESAFLEGVDEYRSFKSFWGHQIWDEPGLKDYNTIAAMKELYSEIFPDKLFYVNLQPVYSPAHYLLNGMWTTKTDAEIEYSNYLSEYMNLIKPEYISYDFYPMLVEGLHMDYFYQLSTVSRLARKHSVPFWVYIQSCTWNKSEARLPDGNELLWQINTSVAYGATGLQYFCFFTPYSNKDEDYDIAMIDFYGRPTALYDYAARAHHQLHSISHMLLDAAFIGVIKSGKVTAPVPDTDIISVEEIESIDGDLLIGIFDNKGKKYLYVVCDSLLKERQQVNIVFSRAMNCLMTINGETTVHRTCHISQSLSGGEAFFVELGEL